jgi:hypothetical protein
MSALSARKRQIGTWAIGIFAAAWLAAIGSGQRVMLNYDYTAASPAAPPTQWPHESSVARTQRLPTIVVFAHPHCPCTRATIEALARLMARLQNRATAAVVFEHPRGVSDDWVRTDLWKSAARIPGVTVTTDADGLEASRFGARASGQTMLYSTAGDLRFSGGIHGVPRARRRQRRAKRNLFANHHGAIRHRSHLGVRMLAAKSGTRDELIQENA